MSIMPILMNGQSRMDKRTGGGRTRDKSRKDVANVGSLGLGN